ASDHTSFAQSAATARICVVNSAPSLLAGSGGAFPFAPIELYQRLLPFLPVLVLSSERPAATRSNAARINGTIEPDGPSLSQRLETTPATATTTAATSCGYNSFARVAPMRSAMALANSLCADADALRTSP